MPESLSLGGLGHPKATIEEQKLQIQKIPVHTPQGVLASQSLSQSSFPDQSVLPPDHNHQLSTQPVRNDSSSS